MDKRIVVIPLVKDLEYADYVSRSGVIPIRTLKFEYEPDKGQNAYSIIQTCVTESLAKKKNPKFLHIDKDSYLHLMCFLQEIARYHTDFRLYDSIHFGTVWLDIVIIPNVKSHIVVTCSTIDTIVRNE